MNARFGLEDSIRRGDSNAVRRFFRAMEKSSKIAGMIMSVILIFVAVSIFVTAFHTSQEAACETPAFPAEAGAAPMYAPDAT